MRNPILIELTRGALVESVHAGTAAIAQADGRLLASLGVAGRPIFPRSAIKPMQAMPLIETGAAAAFGFGPEEIAIACGSHSGTPRHADLVLRMLNAARLAPAALGCGVHDPFDGTTARALIRAGEKPTALNHNCSGKHAAMLATAVHMGEPTDDYWRPDHPVQVRIRGVLEDMAGVTLEAGVCGIDGCSVPNWAIPPACLARSFARLATGEGLSEPRADACAAIIAACIAHPDLVAGPGRFDTLTMQRRPGRLLVKSGAEGVVCGALLARGIGFAIKIDDGAKRGAEAAAAELIARFHSEVRDAAPDPVLRNWRGLEVGVTRPAAALAEILRTLE